MDFIVSYDRIKGCMIALKKPDLPCDTFEIMGMRSNVSSEIRTYQLQDQGEKASLSRKLVHNCKLCCKEIDELFPGFDSEGVFLTDSKEQIIGHLIIAYEEGEHSSKLYTSFLKVLSARASTELERLKAENELNNYKNELENIVDERTKSLIENNRRLTKEIEEHKKTQKLLEKSREQAEIANIAKSAFLANMSHEIRTPLNGIIGILSLLKSESLSQKEKNEYIDVMDNSSDTLLRIINDILDLSKLEAGHVEFEYSRFNIAETLDDIVCLYKATADKKNLKLKLIKPVQNQNEDFLVVSDQSRIRQVVSNLVSNAIKFTNEGGVTITLAFKEDRDSFTVTVKDSGIGMSEQQTARVFERFVQGDCSTTRKYGGTGLGLSIVKLLVDRLEGVISIDSEPNSGTSLEIEMPKNKNRVLTPTESIGMKISEQIKTNKITNKDKQRILLAEDNKVNQLVAVTMLNKLGVDVDVAEDGKEAVEMYNSNDYSLVILDCLMPKMDGFEALNKIKKLEGGNLKIPVVALTANAMDEDKKECLDAGFSDFFSKPIKLDELQNMLYKHISDAPVFTN